MSRIASIVTIATLAVSALAQSTKPIVVVGHYFPDGAVSTYQLERNGTLTYVDTYPTGEWTLSLAISPNGRWLATANGTSATDEEFRIFEINSDASLTHRLTFIHSGSPLEIQWVDDEFLAATATNITFSFLWTLRWNPDLNEMTARSNVSTGTFTSSFAVDRATRKIYANDSSFGIYRISVSPDGVLSSDGGFDTFGLYQLGLRQAPNGHLYAGAGIQGDLVLGFQDLDDALLGWLPLAPYDTSGDSPAYMAPSTDGEFLMVGHGRDATIRSFRILESGDLEETGFMYDVGSQGAIGEMLFVGDYLVATDDTSWDDDKTGILTFRITPDGDFVLIEDREDDGIPRPEVVTGWAPEVIPGCPGDLTGEMCDSDLFPEAGDCRIDNNDLGVLLAAYLATEGEDRYLSRADLFPREAPDGVINNNDLAEVLADYLNDCN